MKELCILKYFVVHVSFLIILNSALSENMKIIKFENMMCNILICHLFMLDV